MKKTFPHILKNIMITLMLPVGMYIILFALTAGRFGPWATVISVLRTAVVPMLIAMGMSYNMSMGMWDFSVGAVIHVAAILSANISSALSLGITGVCLFAILISLALSALSGLVYNRLRIPALVLSIGLTMVYEAIPSILIANKTGRIPMMDGYLAQEPWSLMIVAIMFAVFYILYNHTVFGKEIQAIGANITVANNAGVNLDKVKFRSFLIGGLFFGIAAIEFLSL